MIIIVSPTLDGPITSFICISRLEHWTALFVFMKFERLWLLGRHGVYLREFSNQRGSKGNYWVGWRRTLSRMAMFYAIADTQLCLFQHYSSRWGEKEKGYWT